MMKRSKQETITSFCNKYLTMAGVQTICRGEGWDFDEMRKAIDVRIKMRQEENKGGRRYGR